VLVHAVKDEQWKLVVCCDHALPVNSVMNAMRKATEEWTSLSADRSKASS
jgi:hypothetical protein